MQGLLQPRYGHSLGPPGVTPLRRGFMLVFMHGWVRRRQHRTRCWTHAATIYGVAILLAGTLGASRSANAQAIDEYVNANVLSPGTDPGVTVQSRAHPDYDPTGIRVGLVTLSPFLDEGIGYDDNVTGTPNAKGSVVIDTHANLKAEANTGDTKYTAALDVADTKYLSASDQSFTDWSAQLSGTHDFGQDQLYVAGAHYNLNQTPRDLGVSDLDSAIAYRFDEVTANYIIGLSQLTIQPGMDVSWYSFDNGTVLGLPYDQSYRDRIVYQPNITANYALAPRRSLVFVLRDANSSYDTVTPGIPTQNFNDVSVLGGALPTMSTASIGIRLCWPATKSGQFFLQSVYKDDPSAHLWKRSLTWTPTELTTVTGTAARYITDSAAEGTVGKTETSSATSISTTSCSAMSSSMPGCGSSATITRKVAAASNITR